MKTKDQAIAKTLEVIDLINEFGILYDWNDSLIYQIEGLNSDEFYPEAAQEVYDIACKVEKCAKLLIEAQANLIYS